MDKAFDCAFDSLNLRIKFFGEGSIETLESYQNLAALYEK